MKSCLIHERHGQSSEGMSVHDYYAHATISRRLFSSSCISFRRRLIPSRFGLFSKKAARFWPSPRFTQCLYT